MTVAVSVTRVDGCICLADVEQARRILQQLQNIGQALRKNPDPQAFFQLAVNCLKGLDGEQIKGQPKEHADLQLIIAIIDNEIILEAKTPEMLKYHGPLADCQASNLV